VRRERAILLLAVLAGAANAEEPAERDCPVAADAIEADRPDVTNSSLVVPLGSLQNENGINLTRRIGSSAIDGTNSRLRLGVAHCLEVLVDLPDYTRTWNGAEPSGFSDLAPAIKKQLGPLPGDIDLSATVGLGLPIGSSAVAGRGYQPYLQFPWSRAIGEGWGLSGMLTAFWFPSVPGDRRTLESTLSLEREVGENADLFAEFVGDFRSAGSSQYLNFGGAYRVTRTQQIDFHTGFGLSDRAPQAFFGIGYSWRSDRR
jgi:hypothetical protein